MRSRPVRIAVWVLALAVLAGTGYMVVDLQRQVAAERAASQSVDDEAYRAALLVERLRAAQQSYVAEGQGPAFWMTRVGETASTLEQALGTLARDAGNDGTRSAAQAALGALADYESLDRRARGLVERGSRAMASDLIFTDSLGATTAIASNIEKARADQRHASDARLADLERQQMMVLGGGAAIALALTLLLVAPVGRPAPKDTREALRALIADTAPAGAAVIRTDGTRSAPAMASSSLDNADEGAVLISREPVPPPAAPAPASPVPTTPALDLAPTAALCSELARVFDPADLPPLLGRAATLLDASGLIVWVADRDGSALFPVVAHGYSQSLLARMSGIRRDADNAAAAAWRQAELRTVPAQGQSPGALVTPIVTPEGCVGVLAAETRNGSEALEPTQAIARIVAAQLATLVTTFPTTTQPTSSLPENEHASE